mmetsp:Transcript_29335/g.86936  ORF Transcript_29335/g.86936 Transcript_29335/m.86936 type:complete len:313 (-) Transcript_29335:293-1231(-)
MFPTDAIGDSSVDYTNPAHAAALAVMMQNKARISSSLDGCAGSQQQRASAPAEPQEASCSSPRTNDAPVPAPQQQSRVVRRSSLSSAPPRRSSLRSSSYGADVDREGGRRGGDDSSSSSISPSRRRMPRRRSSVTFNSDANETKTVPKVDCPVQRNELFYKAEDYTQFRREHIREKRAEVRERAAMMMRWKSSFGSSGPSKKGGGQGGVESSSPPKIAAFGRIKSTTTATTAQFANNFRRSATHTQTTQMTYHFAPGSPQKGGKHAALAFAARLTPDQVRAHCAAAAVTAAGPGPNVSLPSPVKHVRTARLA